MKYYIEKDKEGRVTTKGTVSEGVTLADKQIELTEEEFNNTEQYIVPVDEDILWNRVRRKRDLLLRETDWTQVIDTPLTVEQKEQYILYRQALRDIPQMYEHAEDVVWPTLYRAERLFFSTK